MFTFVLITLGAVGCGPKQFDVSGKVTYNGGVLDKPDGHIVFLGPNSEQVDTIINRDGTYSASAVNAGKNRVVVYYLNPQSKAEKPARLKPGEIPKSLVPACLTPQAYASPNTSELSIEVDKETVYDINLKGPPIP
jgi:hypothetical protein